MNCPTMKTRLLALLRREWVTPVVALNKVGCFSLSQRCGEFRNKLGLPIVDKWVTTPGGSRVKAYRLGK